MIRFFITFFFLINCINYVNAEIVTQTGVHRHLEDVSIREGCEYAKKDALTKAKEKVLGLKILSEENEMCNQVDGKSNCIRNQLFLNENLGHITGLEIIERERDIEKFDNSEEDIYVCKVTIKVNVEKRSETLDSSYDFSIKINNLAFRENEKLEIDINLTKPVFLNLFQWLPYEKNDQIYKIFPNQIETNNYIETNNFQLPIKNTTKKKAKYVIEFPKNVKDNRVDEHLLFVFSQKDINFLPTYLKREDLMKKYMSENSVKLIYKTYSIIK